MAKSTFRTLFLYVKITKKEALDIKYGMKPLTFSQNFPKM